MANGEKSYLAIVLGILIVILAIQAVFSFLSYTIGVFLFLGLLFYFMLFIYRNKKMKKEELDRILYYERSWIGRNRTTLSKEIP
jgi:hypothetical protein